MPIYVVRFCDFININTYVESSQFPNLRILDLSSCGLTSWRDINASLGSLPNLEELMLDDNPIEVVEPQEEGMFVSLRRFSLSSTK